MHDLAALLSDRKGQHKVGDFMGAADGARVASFFTDGPKRIDV